jgi:TIR domain
VKIFISYRREDGAQDAGRIRDRLSWEFPSASIFMDVDDIPPGAEFVSRINEAISGCDALLVVIGRRWLDLLSDRGRRGGNDQTDYVRIEIGSALKRDIPVIPILLDGAQMPGGDLLPDDIKALSNRNGLSVRFASFQRDVDPLVRRLRPFSDSWATRMFKSLVVREVLFCLLAWLGGVVLSLATLFVFVVMLAAPNSGDSFILPYLGSLCFLTLIAVVAARRFAVRFWPSASGILSLWAAIPAGLVMLNILHPSSYGDWAKAWAVFGLVSGGIVSTLLLLYALLKRWWSSIILIFKK